MTDACAAGLGRGRAANSGRSRLQQANQGPRCRSGPCEFAPLFNATTADAELAACDLIVEAIVENPEAKKQLFARLEPLLEAEDDSGFEHVDDSDHATGRRA